MVFVPGHFLTGMICLAGEGWSDGMVLAEDELTCNFLQVGGFGLLMSGLRVICESCGLTPTVGVSLFFPFFLEFWIE